MTWILVICIVLLALWSFAEAFSWPVAPDAALAVVVFMLPSLAFAATGVVILSTAAGGAAGLLLYRRGYRWPLPLVTDRMRGRVSKWLDGGATGLIHQPLTAVPYKAFVVDGARRPFRVLAWSVLTGVFRGPRMTAVAIAATVVARVIERSIPPAHLLTAQVVVLAVAGVGFVIGWRLVWMLWARPSQSVSVQSNQLQKQ
ncbi:MAG: hypothetical protein ACR2N7_05115 [Acidimicrobiia bacterium]